MGRDALLCVLVFGGAAAPPCHQRSNFQLL